MTERRREGMRLKEQILDYSPIVIGILGLASSVSGFIDRTESDLRKEVGKVEIRWAESLSEREWEILRSLDYRELMEEKRVNYIKQNGGDLYEKYIEATNFGVTKRGGGIFLLALAALVFVKRVGNR